MSDRRAVPWYRVFAANDLSSRDFYRLSAGERGLLDSMMRACWIDQEVPADPALLALVVRLPPDDVTKHLTPAVLAHFEDSPLGTEALISREIWRQLADVTEVRKKQASGGRLGAAMTNARRRNGRKAAPDKGLQEAASTPASQPASQPAGLGRVPSIKSVRQ